MAQHRVTLLIDSNYLGYEAIYTTGEMSYRGKPTGVIYGFLNRIIHLGCFFKTNRFVFCWDSKTSKRKNRHGFYKEKRRKDLSEKEKKRLKDAYIQFAKLRRDILPQIGFGNVIAKKGYESDDVIANIALRKTGGDYIIISSDEDLYQLIRHHVRLYNPRKNKMMTIRRFQDKYGIHPSGWWRVKAIAGCKSDSVPGVYGVGEERALKYLRKELSPSTKAYRDIETMGSLFDRNKWLVKLPMEGMKRISLHKDKFSLIDLAAVFQEHGFRSLLAKERMLEWANLFDGQFEEERKVRHRGIRDVISKKV